MSARSRPSVQSGRQPRAGDRRHSPEIAAHTVSLLAVALAFSTSLTIQFALPKLFVLRAALAVLGALWLWRLHRGEIVAVPRSIAASVAGLAGWWIVVTIAAQHVPTALNGAPGRYNGLWTELGMLSVFAFVATTNFDESEVETLAARYAAVLVPTAAYAVMQLAGMDPLPWPEDRAASTIGNPVILAAILAMAAPVALTFTLISSRGTRARWAVVTALLGLAALATFSRGPLVAMALAMTGVLVSAARDRRARLSRSQVIAGVAIAAVVAIAGGAAVIESRARHAAPTATGMDRTIADRMNTYRAAASIVRDRPLTGVGLENFAIVYPQYRTAESEQLTPDVLPTMVHSGYLQSAAMTGIPGLLIYAVMLSTVGFTVFRALRHSNGRRRRILTGMTCGLLAYLLQDATGWMEISLSYFFWFLLGVTVAFARGHDRALSPRVRIPAALTVGGWCVVMAYLAFDTATLLRADTLIRSADGLSVRDQWPAIEPRLNRAVQMAPTATYLSKAGVRYAERFAISGADADARRSAGFLDAAQLENPFAVYSLVHRLRLEALRLDKRLQADSPRAESVVARLRVMDPNNATVHETIARFRLSQGRLNEAAEELSTARALRPSQGSLRVLEGDIERQRNNRVGSVAAYRAALDLFHQGDRDWVLAYQRMLVTMLEARMPAVEAARRLSEVVPGESMSHTLLGFGYLQMRDKAPALEAFRHAVRLDPDNIGARDGLKEAEALPQKP